ncbi:zinc finger protein 35 [Drosophila virilis]|uniref:Uncharacterized protein n=1 Tax=Drosophila virilis TaxID=7244 RepID=B4ME16_DROVI|nr:zinc finger protein 35 [Drosophila virilis]EDW58781.1 uncharacterized protein Dvir_GJ18442 [Drosophila virilis]
MEEEITPAATTNGVAENGEDVETEPQPQPQPQPEVVSATNAWAASSAIVEEEEAEANTVVYMAEGNAAAHVEPQTSVVAAEEHEEEEEVDGEEEMGEVEYLEDEMADDECDDERELTEVEEDASAAVNNKEDEPTAVAPSAAAESAPSETAEEPVEDSVDEAIEESVDDSVEEAVEELVEAEDEGEIITGDDAQPDPTEEANASARSGAQAQVEPVDETQCRVCTTKDQLVSLFTKTSEGSTPADMLLLLCPSVSIAPKDFMPQFICNGCLESLTIAIKLRQQLETTERELRKRLSRSKNKVRRPRGYVVIDAPVSDSASEEDEEELNDDVEFKVSDVAGSTSGDSDSADTDISEKRKPGRRRGRKKGTKRSAGANSQEEENHKRRSLQTSPAASQGPFECDQCDLSFPRKQSYVMHRKMHDSRHEFHCQICNKKFKVRGAYKTHMERHAAERAQFRCELCAQIFRLRAELKRHMALSHDEHGIIYECKRCQRTFLTQTRLQRHQSTNCNRHSETKVKRQAMEGHPSQGRDLFKSVAPLTTTYWSDSFSD